MMYQNYNCMLNLLIQNYKLHIQVIRNGLLLRNVDGSSSNWEYHLPVQPYLNIYSYSISDKTYQQLTQHTVYHTIIIKMVANFINLFNDKALKSVFFMLKQVPYLLFPQHDDPLIKLSDSSN